MDFKQFLVLTFDCYGTLIDWERGILNALKPIFARQGVISTDREILELYSGFESEAEKGPYRPYREILRSVFKEYARHFMFQPRPEDERCLVESLPSWPPFPDTIEALRKLKKHYRLAIISNIDNELLKGSLKLLQVEFDWLITAEMVHSYKPSTNNFQHALKSIGLPNTNILHVAQSLYHDIAPAHSLGISTVWVNRRKGKEGSGATPVSDIKPDLEVPDLISLANRIE